MDLNGLTVFQQMQEKMHWLSTRQSILSQNVANADTPGYVPRDLKAFTFSKALDEANGGSITLAATQPGHIGFGAKAELRATRDKTVVETNPSGNSVSLEDQLTKVADTGMDYQLLTNLYRKQVSLIKTAAGRGSNA